jgi:hypothetical protein
MNVLLALAPPSAERAARDARARALWRDARTPELRAHLRLIYPLWREATTGPVGINSQVKDNDNIIIQAEKGTSKSYTLARLKRDHPKLFESVVAGELSADAERKREVMRSRWPDEFRLGYRFGRFGKADSPCDRAGYPQGFHGWPLDRRNAWWCGWNRGRVDMDHANA